MSGGKNSFLGKFLKGAAITLLIITILLTVVGAAGTGHVKTFVSSKRGVQTPSLVFS